jgi:hypothetical protein
MRLLLTTLAALVALLTTPGCGSDETKNNGSTTGEPMDAGDGRYHPPGNGQHVAEDAACSALQSAQESKVQSLQCPITTRTCPSLLRVEFGVACLEYDEGSVQGCVDYYKSKMNCDDLAVAIKDCVVTQYVGSEPNGCPMMP